MNHKLTTVSAVVGVLLSLSACTPRQIAASIAIESQSTGPAVSATVDCQTFDIAIAGLSATDRVIAVTGSEPPYGLTVGDDGHVAAQISIGVSQQGYKFLAAIDVVHADGTSGYVFEQDVDCTA